MPKILLDRDGNSDPLAGYRVVETEVDLLRYAITGDNLLIRGHTLCEWAESFYKGRNIACSNAPSLISDLMQTYGNMTEEQARYIGQKLETEKIELTDNSPYQILIACFPTNLWDAPASISHAADWLLWLDKTEVDDAFQAIFSAIVYDWKLTQPELSDLYDASTPEEARSILEKWFGAYLTPLLDKFGEFPISVPKAWIDRLREPWVSNMIKTQGAFFSDFIKAPTLRQLKLAIADVALDYFESNPEFISLEACNQISRFVSGKGVERLAKLRPVPEPRNIPEEPDGIINWFIYDYLPFRSWDLVVNTIASHTRALELGRQFAEWYLKFYPTALNSKGYISFYQSSSLLTKYPDSVILLVVLDGLHYLDAKIIRNALLVGKETRHLEMIVNSPCFAPIPTVTEYTKGALVRGVQPSMIKEIQILGADISEQNSPIKTISLAKPGEMIIWRIQEPDTTYHKKNKNSTLVMEVEGQLSTIAQKILDVVGEVSFSVDLKIVITTDHGRYLGISKRIVEVPQDMESHGRAAWGRTNIVFPKSGYVINDNIAFLSSDRYGLDEAFGSDDVAVILSDNAFRDKRFEQEKYPHGGLFPEEVIIPWMVFARNVEKPKVEVSLLGEGVANQRGKLQLIVTNPSQMNLEVTKSEFIFGSDKIFIFDNRYPVFPLKQTKIELDIPSWPSSEQAQTGSVRIVLALPSEDELDIYPTLSDLKVKELYTRDKSLLEGLDI